MVADHGGFGSGLTIYSGFVTSQQGQFYIQPQALAAGNFLTPTMIGFGSEQYGQLGNAAGCLLQQTGASMGSNQQGQALNFNGGKPTGPSSGGANAGNRSQMVCYKCENPGHAVKECQTVLSCVNCTKTRICHANALYCFNRSQLLVLLVAQQMGCKCFLLELGRSLNQINLSKLLPFSQLGMRA